MSRSPNIVLIMADQLTAGALRAYGNPVCRTPHLDRLAARGSVFTQAYCNFPVCAPSRASLLTGQLASRLGVYDNASDFRSSAPTLPYYLNALGYHTCLSGKMHFVGADQLHGYQERLTTDIYPSDFGWTPDWRKMIPVAATGLNLRSVVESGICRRSLQLDYDDEVAARAVQRIYDYGRDREQPFFLTVSFTHPHNPYVITESYWSRYADDEIDPPRVPAGRPEALDPHSQRLRRIYRFDEYDITEADVMRSRHAYYAMISYVDDRVGEIVAALDTMDLLDDTIIVFTSDHGDMLGEKGLWYKWMLLEGAVRVPLIIAAPHQQPGIAPAPVSLLDLAPTLLELAGAERAGLEAATPFEGRSLAPALLNPDALAADWPVFSEMTADGAHHPCLMVRAGAWKYIHCADDPPMLFNLEDDPDELRNLAALPAYARQAGRLLDLIRTHWDEQALAAAMRRSAAERQLIQAARLGAGHPAWDYEPRRDPTQQFVRTGANVSATMVKGRARYPQIEPKPTDREVPPL
ncbi:MAG: choline-sulfatase [Pigmentiphaga sp.]